MTTKEQAHKIICNVVAWVEVNRQLRPSWVQENFSSMLIQECKVFKTGMNAEFSHYSWKLLFRSKNLIYQFDSVGKLVKVSFMADRLHYTGFADNLNKGFAEALEEIEQNGLPSSVTQVLIDRLDRVKTLGLGTPSNVVVVDMRKLDAISFKPEVPFRVRAVN